MASLLVSITFSNCYLVVNAEHAAHKSEKFTHMARRTRYEYLKDVANNQVSQQTLETSNKFGKNIFSVCFITRRISITIYFSPKVKNVFCFFFCCSVTMYISLYNLKKIFMFEIFIKSSIFFQLFHLLVRRRRKPILT